MHVTAQSTNLESVPATNNQQQQSSALESHSRGGESGSNLNSGRSNKTTTSLSGSVDGKKQHGTTNLDDEVSFFLSLETSFCIDRLACVLQLNNFIHG